MSPGAFTDYSKTVHTQTHNVNKSHIVFRKNFIIRSSFQQQKGKKGLDLDVICHICHPKEHEQSSSKNTVWKALPAQRVPASCSCPQLELRKPFREHCFRDVTLSKHESPASTTGPLPWPKWAAPGALRACPHSSCSHTTSALLRVQSVSHTVCHTSPWRTSTLPEHSSLLPASRTSKLPAKSSGLKWLYDIRHFKFILIFSKIWQMNNNQRKRLVRNFVAWSGLAHNTFKNKDIRARETKWYCIASKIRSFVIITIITCADHASNWCDVASFVTEWPLWALSQRRLPSMAFNFINPGLSYAQAILIHTGNLMSPPAVQLSAHHRRIVHIPGLTAHSPPLAFVIVLHSSNAASGPTGQLHVAWEWQFFYECSAHAVQRLSFLYRMYTCCNLIGAITMWTGAECSNVSNNAFNWKMGSSIVCPISYWSFP